MGVSGKKGRRREDWEGECVDVDVPMPSTTEAFGVIRIVLRAPKPTVVVGEAWRIRQRE